MEDEGIVVEKPVTQTVKAGLAYLVVYAAVEQKLLLLILAIRSLNFDNFSLCIANTC